MHFTAEHHLYDTGSLWLANALRVMTGLFQWLVIQFQQLHFILDYDIKCTCYAFIFYIIEYTQQVLLVSTIDIVLRGTVLGFVLLRHDLAKSVKYPMGNIKARVQM